jgi:hypothetical protein
MASSTSLRLASHHLELHNARSLTRFTDASKRFAGHVATIKELKSDLDSVFGKLRWDSDAFLVNEDLLTQSAVSLIHRLLKMKMRNRYPEQMDAAQEEFPDIELPDD